MYSIAHITPDQVGKAPQSVQNVYAAFDGRSVPEPLQLLSASPQLLERQFETMHYFMPHGTLSFPLLAGIRYAVARAQNYSCCTDFNGTLLQRCGMTLPDLDALYAYADGQREANSDDGGLEEREQQLVRFVVHTVQQPESVTGETLDALRTLGWSDQDIFEAVSHGVTMVSTSILDTAFRTR